MPSRAAHLIAFLTITLVSVSCHVYIFRQFARMIRRDFPGRAGSLLKVAKPLFVYFDLPFIYLFLWKHIPEHPPEVTQFLLYPFTVWQIVMLVWAVILLPIGLVRSKRSTVFFRSTKRLILKPIAKAARRSLRPKNDVILEPTEELIG
jgi:hypothetical protein